MKKLFLISSSLLLVITLGLFISTNTYRQSQDIRSNASTLQIDESAETAAISGTTGSPTPTTQQGVTPSTAATITIGATTSPTSSPSGSTFFIVNLFLHGLGTAGDSVNPIGQNNTMLHIARSVTLSLLNTQNQAVVSKEGLVTYNPTIGGFTGTIAMGSLSSVPSGNYTLHVKVSQYLPFEVPAYLHVPNGGTFTIPNIALVAGDINNDGVLDILDYTAILNCYSDFSPPASCTTSAKNLSDLTDDGLVDQLDYNLFIRELTAESGD